MTTRLRPVRPCDNCGKTEGQHDAGRLQGRSQLVCEVCLHRLARSVGMVERAVRRVL